MKKHSRTVFVPDLTTDLAPLSMTPSRLSSRSSRLTTVFMPVVTVLATVLTPRRAVFQVFMEVDADKCESIDAIELGATMTRMTVLTTDDYLRACHDCPHDCLDDCLDFRCLWSLTRTSLVRLTRQSSAPP